ncbi:MAG: sulfatase-like hydrolase/transferase [Gemmataceae bacterium]|nr:sulfatase-like hydrolase/transferase [Gemmataceae bacterium]
MRAIVFILRGCPAGSLGAYGNEWGATPNLDRVAAEGVAFDRHVSDCPDPAAAARAWLTGRHQMPAISGVTPPPPGEGLLAALRPAGVRTVLVRANHPDIDRPAPFYAGWAEVFDARPDADDPSPLSALERAFPSVLDRLGQDPRWLLWVDIDRLVPPWEVPQEVFEAYIGDADEEDAEYENEGEEDEPAPADEDTEPITPLADPPHGPFDNKDLAAWEYLHATHAALVTTLDAELGRLFDQLRGRGLDQTAGWLVTADYGHPLGEHGQVGPHRPWLHEEFVHLPLLLRLPGAAEAGRRVPALTQPADLLPTLLDLFGVEPPADIHGHSLLPLARGEAESVRPHVCSGLEVNGVAEWAIRTDGWAYLLPGPQPDGDPPREPLLFEKPDDRWEVNDLRSRNIERADELEATLRAAVAAAAARRPGPPPPPPAGLTTATESSGSRSSPGTG